MTGDIYNRTVLSTTHNQFYLDEDVITVHGFLTTQHAVGE